jgi:hypothetical protein
MAPQLGLAQVAHLERRKLGKTRLPVTSPAMTARFLFFPDNCRSCFFFLLFTGERPRSGL